MTSPLSISLRNCSKTFADGTLALQPLDLDIPAGKTVVFLGPSGCGKTTTLRLIAGLEQPDEGGQVLFDGEDVTMLPIEKRRIGMVFQSYALFPNMTVAENIGYGLRISKTPAGALKERVREMLAMMRIEALADRRIDQLSGGQRQRVALGRALAIRPRALLLDEPLTALDAKLRDTLRVEIDALLRSLNITAIYVTHDQDEAMALGDVIVVMDHGRVAQVGSPRDIYHQPASRFVAEFIGTMNRLTGTVNDGVFSCPAGTFAWADLPTHATEVMFRPEDVRIVDGAADVKLSGTVAGVFFLGDRTRLLIDVGEERPVIVENAARADVQRGDRVALQIDARGLLVMPGGV
ncbi:MAG: ABC transporter ATP-binding protein [Rhizobacter sp.]